MNTKQSGLEMMWEISGRETKTSSNIRISGCIKKEKWHRKMEAKRFLTITRTLFLPESNL